MKKIVRILLSVTVVVFIIAITFAFAIGYALIPVKYPDTPLTEFTTAVSLMIAFWTLLATVLIAIYIYNRQKRDGKRAEEKKKRAAVKFMGLAAADAVKWLICEPEDRQVGACYRIREYLNRYEEELAEILTHQQLQTLFVLTETMEKAVHEEEEVVDCSFLFRDWLKIPMQSTLSQYSSLAMEQYDLLDKAVYSLLKALEVPGTEKEYRNLTVIPDIEGGIVFAQTETISADADKLEVCNGFEDSFFQKHAEELAAVIEKTKHSEKVENGINVLSLGRLIASGGLGLNLYDNYAVENGYTCTERYRGFVHDFMRHGKGMEYSELNKKLKEGYWCEDELAAGIEYDQIIKDPTFYWKEETQEYEGTEDSDTRIYTQYWGNILPQESLRWVEPEIEQEGWEGFYVADIKTFGVGRPVEFYNIRSLREYALCHNPDWVEYMDEEIRVS